MILTLLLACDPTAPSVAGPQGPFYDGPDAARAQVAVALTRVASGFEQITDLQFPPGDSGHMVVLQKAGEARWVDLQTGQQTRLLDLDVETDSECGLLGLAFHPKYANNHKIYLNYIPDDKPLRTVVAQATVDPATGAASTPRPILEQPQPYANHDGGQLAFGPDGMLYIGLGDGGAAGDPHQNAQNPGTWLGKMLRIQVDVPATAMLYSVPDDNPFRGKEGYLPEIWAMGLRNPWRFSFDDRGRLIAGDVGQNTTEEIDLVRAGANLGWDVREADRCFEPAKGCRAEGLDDPIYSYPRTDGNSITGGVVSRDPALPELSGWWVFGDFASGRLWALDVRGELTPGATAPVVSLGRWFVRPSTFGRDAAGRVYVADFSGAVYRLDPVTPR